VSKKSPDLIEKKLIREPHERNEQGRVRGKVNKKCRFPERQFYVYD